MADENRVKSYKTVYRGGMGEIVEKKSRFIAHVAHVESEEEALAFVEKIKKEYWDARHNCHAFTVGIPHETARCSDDGEPAQTAGKPMLDVFNRAEAEEYCGCGDTLFWRNSFGNRRSCQSLFCGCSGRTSGESDH